MNPSHEVSFPGSCYAGWVPVLGLVLGFLLWDTRSRDQHVQLITQSYGVTVAAPATDAGSITGYASGRRSLILPDRSLDGYHWIMQAESMIAEGQWRVRHVDYDGVPQGRDVHWAAPFHWWLIGLAWIERLWSGQPWGIAIEHAAIWSGPVMLALLLIGVSPMLATRFGPASAALFCIGSVAAWPFYVDFLAGYPDHHGLVNACALLAVLGALRAAGDCGTQPAGHAGARRWAVASAVAGGLGLWLSAATLIPVLIALGLGGAAACWVARGETRVYAWLNHPRLFRVWGATGASVSLAAYLVEYFPGQMGLRLEVNHPLYALAWAAGGEVLCRWASILGARPTDARGRDGWVGAIALLLAAVAPLTLWMTRRDSFVVADSFLWRLHRDYISEFQGLPDYLARGGYGWSALAPCFPVLVLLPGIWLANRPGTARASRALLLQALFPALCILPLAWSQVRWWSLESALLIPVLAAIFQTLHREPVGRRWSVGAMVAVCVLLYLPGAILAVGQAAAGTELTTEDIRTLAERDAAHWLRLRAGRGKVMVAGSPTTTTSFIFHGGLQGVGTLYWENIVGLKTAAELYAAHSDAGARAVVQRCGITHIVVISWDGFEGVYTRLARGLAGTEPIPGDAFIFRLLTAPVPPGWLRLIPFRLPPHPALVGQEIRIYEVTPDQSPAETLVNTTGYLLEMGTMDAAGKMAPWLAAQGDDLASVAMLAEIASRQGDKTAFTATLDRMIRLLPQANTLPFEYHVQVVALLASARRFDLAGSELQPCLNKMTEENLRRLSPDTLAHLLALTTASGVGWPDHRLRQLATELLPPALR